MQTNRGIHFAVDAESDRSLCRYPDGNETNNCEQDFYETAFLSPGSCNVLFTDLELSEIKLAPQTPDSTDEIQIQSIVKTIPPLPYPLTSGTTRYPSTIQLWEHTK